MAHGKFLIDKQIVFILALLGLVVILPSIGLIWLLITTIESDELVMDKRVDDFYSSRLSVVPVLIADFWDQQRADLSAFDKSSIPGKQFEQLVINDAADSVIIYGSDGRLMYPILPIESPYRTEMKDIWETAQKKEFEYNDFLSAGSHYKDIAVASRSRDIKAQALQGQIRCLTKLGRHNDAIRIIENELNQPGYSEAKDTYGRLIVPNLNLMVLQKTSASSDYYRHVLNTLSNRLTDYNKADYFPSSQRFFLMRQLRKLNKTLAFPTLNAEEILNTILKNGKLFIRNSTLLEIIPNQLFLLTSGNGRVTGLFTKERIKTEVTHLVKQQIVLPNIEIYVLQKRNTDIKNSFYRMDLGPEMPGWELRLKYTGQDALVDSSVKRRNIFIGVTALLVISISTIALLIAVMLIRQIRLAQLKNDFIATVSHELKTPLTSIRVFVDLLLEKNIEDKQQIRKYLGLIGKENRRLSRSIDGFLSFSRLERETQTFHFVEMNPREIISESLIAVNQVIPRTSERIQLDLEQEIQNIKADKDALVTVMTNLIENAYKYSNDRPDIRVSLKQRGGFACFQVADSGIGISKRHFKKIFEKFYQVDTRLSRNASGSGLGLSIVQEIVEAHQGKIEVISELGKGSIFRVYIPFTGSTFEN